MTDAQVRAEQVLIDQGKRSLPKAIDPPEDVHHSLILATASFAEAEEVSGLRVQQVLLIYTYTDLYLSTLCNWGQIPGNPTVAYD